MQATLPFLISIQFFFFVNLPYLGEAYYCFQFWPLDPPNIIKQASLTRHVCKVVNLPQAWKLISRVLGSTHKGSLKETQEALGQDGEGFGQNTKRV